MNCANFDICLQKLPKTVWRFHIFSRFPPFYLSNDFKIQFDQIRSPLIWGCPNFLFLRTFLSEHSFCLKNSSKNISILCHMNKTLVKSSRRPFEHSVCLFIYGTLFLFCAKDGGVWDPWLHVGRLRDRPRHHMPKVQGVHAGMGMLLKVLCSEDSIFQYFHLYK